MSQFNYNSEFSALCNSLWQLLHKIQHLSASSNNLSSEAKKPISDRPKLFFSSPVWWNSRAPIHLLYPHTEHWPPRYSTTCCFRFLLISLWRNVFCSRSSGFLFAFWNSILRVLWEPKGEQSRQYVLVCKFLTLPSINTLFLILVPHFLHDLK